MQPAKTFIHLLCSDIACCLEDLLRVMANRVRESRKSVLSVCLDNDDNLLKKLYQLLEQILLDLSYHFPTELTTTISVVISWFSAFLFIYLANVQKPLLHTQVEYLQNQQKNAEVYFLQNVNFWLPYLTYMSYTRENFWAKQ